MQCTSHVPQLPNHHRGGGREPQAAFQRELPRLVPPVGPDFALSHHPRLLVYDKDQGLLHVIRHRRCPLPCRGWAPGRYAICVPRGCCPPRVLGRQEVAKGRRHVIPSLEGHVGLWACGGSLGLPCSCRLFPGPPGSRVALPRPLGSLRRARPVRACVCAEPSVARVRGSVARVRGCAPLTPVPRFAALSAYTLGPAPRPSWLPSYSSPRLCPMGLPRPGCWACRLLALRPRSCPWTPAGSLCLGTFHGHRVLHVHWPRSVSLLTPLPTVHGPALLDRLAPGPPRAPAP